MQRDGIAYCTKPSMGDEPTFVHAYHWMTEQMRKRIGEPPIKGIEYPLWAWYQYNSAKSNKPPRSLHDACEGISAYIEIEIPERNSTRNSSPSGEELNSERDSGFATDVPMECNRYT